MHQDLRARRPACRRCRRACATAIAMACLRMRRAASGDHSLVTCLSFRGGRPGRRSGSHVVSHFSCSGRTAPRNGALVARRGRRAQRAAPRVSERSSLSWPDSPAAFAPRPVQPATRREAGWHGPLSPEAQARLYLEILEESDYAERLAPVVGGEHRDVLDIGAGNGALSRRCLARPARWLARSSRTWRWARRWPGCGRTWPATGSIWRTWRRPGRGCRSPLCRKRLRLQLRCDAPRSRRAL